MFKVSIAAFLAMATAAFAQVPNDLVRTEVHEGWRQGSTHVAGLTIRLAPGWKTYWRSPGDAGIPPGFNWSGSSNVQAVTVQFPVPEVFDQGGMRSIGYEHEVTFPILVTPRDPSAPITLRGDVDIGVCEEICIPVRLNVEAILPEGGAKDETLAKALRSKPEQGGSITCEVSPIADGLRLRATVTMPPMGSEEFAVVEAGNPQIWVSEPSVRRENGRLMAEVEMVPPTAKPFALARSEVRMTVMSAGRAIEMLGCR